MGKGGDLWGWRGGGDYVSKHLFTPKHLSLPSRIINATLLPPFFFLSLQTKKPHENLKIVRGPCRAFIRKLGGAACLGWGGAENEKGFWPSEVGNWGWVLASPSLPKGREKTIIRRNKCKVPLSLLLYRCYFVRRK